MLRSVQLRRWTPALAPVLFTLYPVLYVYASNMEQLGLDDLAEGLLVSLAATLILLLLLIAVLRSINKGAMLAALVLMLFYSYGHVHNIVNPSSHRHLLIPYALVLIFGAGLIIKKGDRLQIPLTFVTLFAAALTTMPLLQIGAYLAGTINRALAEVSIEAAEFKPIPPDTQLPDIYYIIMDGYTRADILRDYYNYDNLPFIEALENRGFYVAVESHSNYLLSFLSLVSSLNMDYLSVTGEGSSLSTERATPYHLIQDGAVTNFLSDAGYTFIQFSSGWGPTDYNPHADINDSHGYFNEFEANLLETTLLKPFARDWIIGQWRQRVLNNFESLALIPGRNEPTFTFTHFVLPHPPYMFGPDGQTTDYDYILGGNRVWAMKDGYRDQVIFANQQLLTLVDRILADSPMPPIIIIQGDHGTASTGGWESADVAFIRERTSILNAYYFPQNGAEHLYPTITPVNSFRVLFNTYFGQQLDQLEDRIYFSTYEQPYEFVEVTGQG